MTIRTNVNQHTPHPAVIAVRDKLDAGAHVRCPGCLGWINKSQAGVVAVFTPFDGSAPIGYALCKRCERHVRGNPAEQQALVERCEIYLMGGATE